MNNNLLNLSNEELWQLFPIILKPHNPNYHSWYREEERNLFRILGKSRIARINHFGSTAIRDLLAKPTVDILLEVKDKNVLEEVSQLISDQEEYICLTQEDNFGKKAMLCLKGYTEAGFKDKVFHIHIRLLNNHKELYFRDYLRDNPKVALAYADLKIDLMKKYKHNRDQYTDSKGKFIHHYTEIAKKIYQNRYLPK